MDDQLNQAALNYHRYPTPGKIAVTPTKGMSNQRDLALAYSPGVAVPCLEIKKDPLLAYDYTAKGNLVAVISNGTAVLGLGNIGAVAGKPVMEGKGCLFKKFAGIDVFDIEIDETDPDKLVETIASLEPTFGGINLEDIKAPECFLIETRLRERMKIPVFHDDQHGTAIVAAAALLNALEVVGKRIEDVKLVCSGAGAAAIACLNIVVGLGVRRENIWVTDSKGVVYRGRTESMDPQKERYAQDTRARTLAEIVPGADVFFGLSMAGVLKPEMVAQMADRPIILAMANPDPEIRPELAKEVRPDCIIATGRSDYPNQVNNVLCFPFIFRGALDVGATTINEEMKLACVRAIAELARADVSDVVAAAYGRHDIRFGPEYLIPPPFDPRLITTVAPAVARGGDGQRRGDPADRRPQGLSGEPAALRLHLGHGDAAGVPGGLGPGDQAHRLRRGRGRPGPARGAGGGRREAGAAGPGRPTGRDPGQGARPRPAADGRPRLRGGGLRRPRVPGSGGRGLLPARPAPRADPGLRGRRDAPQRHPDRRHAGARGPRRRHAVRHVRAVRLAPEIRRRGDRRARGRARARRHASADAAAADRVRVRHLHQPRPDRRAARRHRPARGRGGAPVRPRAAPRLPVAFQLRLGRHAHRAQDARAPWRWSASARPSSRPRARCTPTPRSANACWTRCSPIPA